MFYLNNFIKVLLFFVTGLFYTVLQASPLPADQVFQVSIKALDNKTVLVNWLIKPGYYLYRDKIKLESSPAFLSIELSKARTKKNQWLGRYEVYERFVHALVKYKHPFTGRKIELWVHYQGCSEKGFCYPPVIKHVILNTKEGALNKLDIDEQSLRPKQERGGIIKNFDDQHKIQRLLSSQPILWTLISFFGFGLLLSLTPCVLPLIPILSAIILGQKQLTTAKAFSLSLTYVLSMAFAYALAGVFAGLAGHYLQAFLQNPWIISAICVLFVLLAFSLFGFYDLRLPSSLQKKLMAISNQQKGGNYVGVALMGCLSTLVISPCITAPLVGVLTYIGNAGNAVLGGIALFILGIGSGVPLLVIGTSAGKWLPKSGPWMNGVKILLGIMMLMMAGWLLFRILPAGSWFSSFVHSNAFIKNEYVRFQVVKKTTDLDRVFIKAKQEHKPVLLDFYADWCLSCKEMERFVFSSKEMQSLLTHFILAKADVTANDEADKTLELRFHVIAPPTFLFFTPDGQELKEFRVVGQQKRPVFFRHLQEVLMLK